MAAPPLSFTPITFGAPTLDHPFGLSLYPVFERGFAAVMGHLPQDFRFVSGSTPMSTFGATAAALAGYYVLVFGGREAMRGRQAFKLNGIFMLHNLLLTVISGALLVLFLEQLIPTVVRNGIFYGICNIDGGWTDHLVILYYVSVLADQRGMLIAAAELLDQIPRAAGHGLPLLEEEAADLPPHVPPRRHGPALLHPAHRQHGRLVGAHHAEPDGARRHVLVLLPERPWRPHLVEALHHRHADHPIRR
jgi:hypothetical protein